MQWVHWGIGFAVLCGACGEVRNHSLSDADGGAPASNESAGGSSAGNAPASGGVASSGVASGGTSVSGAGGSAARVIGMDASTGGGATRDASTPSDASRDVVVDARAHDARPEADASPYHWPNSCGPGSDFPVGRYELRVLRMQTDEPVALRAGTGQLPADPEANRGFISMPITVELTITPSVQGGAGYVDVNIPLPLRYNGPSMTLRAVQVVRAEGDSVALGSFPAPPTATPSFGIQIYERSGIVRTFSLGVQDLSTSAWSDTYTGTGVRVCDAIADGGVFPPEVARVGDLGTIPPPGCSTWEWYASNKPTPSCEADDWRGNGKVPVMGCIEGTTETCQSNAFGLTAVCCPGTPLF